MKNSFQEWTESITSDILIPNTITNEWIKSQLNNADDKEQGFNLFMLWGFCYRDLSKYDLSDIDCDLLLKVPFDSTTIWPKMLPFGFDPNVILNKKQKGYQFQEVHNLGITGKGLVVAVIDHPSSIEHKEIKGNIKEYLLLDEKCNSPHFHGVAVLSLLCGKNLGIAPEAEVIFYGGQPYLGETKEEVHQCMARFAIRCLEDIKTKIKSGLSIRIVNMSNSWLYYGGEELRQEAATLRKDLASLGCVIIDSPKFFEDFRYLDCKGTDDFEDIDNYCLPPFFMDDPKKRLNFLSGGKITASYLTKDQYIYDPVGSASYTIPQLTGLYALALQVKPQLTYSAFVAICKDNAIENNKGYRIINPLVTINALRR